jgi:hypothetical protein
MDENYKALLRYYGTHAKGHSRDPFGPNPDAARSAIMSTLKKYQSNIPKLQDSLEGKYGVRPVLTDDKYVARGGRRRRNRRSRQRGGY